MQMVGPGRVCADGRSAPAHSACEQHLPSNDHVHARATGDRAPVPAWRRVGAAMGRRCAWAAERIRNSTGVADCARGAEDFGIGSRLWPRLLLWVFACVALVLTLHVRADGLYRSGPDATIRATAPDGFWTTRFPVLGSLIRRGEAGPLGPRGGPES